MAEKVFIYQVFPRLFGNTKNINKKSGTIDENGVGKFSAFSSKVLSEIKNMGFTHVWFMGVIEHATQTNYSEYNIPVDNPNVVKGIAGSPYAIKDYYDVDPDLADNVENRMEEFEGLIERSHKAGLKVLIDFVPNHVSRQYFSDVQPRKTDMLGKNDDVNVSFNPDNNFYYIPNQSLELQFPQDESNIYAEFPAKVTGNDKFDSYPSINDWYETVKLNYGVDYQNGNSKYFTPIPDTWYKMKDILMFWASKGVDGFRCDMAEMVPVEFWNWAITETKRKYKPLIFIAEVYNPDEYRNYTYTGKFDFLYDKVVLYDALKQIVRGERPTSDITFCWQKLAELQPIMLNFLENHDEQRIASDFFATDPFKAFPAMIVTTTMGINPVMIYSGQELGERGMDEEGFSGLDGKTSIFDYWSVDSLRNWYNNGNLGNSKLTEEQVKLRNNYIRLLKIAGEENAISKGDFFDLMYVNYDNPHFDSTKQYAFLRCFKEELLLIAVNFEKEDVEMAINIPKEAFEYFKVKRDVYNNAKIIYPINKAYKLKKGDIESLSLNVGGYSGQILKLVAK